MQMECGGFLDKNHAARGREVDGWWVLRGFRILRKKNRKFNSQSLTDRRASGSESVGRDGSREKRQSGSGRDVNELAYSWGKYIGKIKCNVKIEGTNDQEFLRLFFTRSKWQTGFCGIIIASSNDQCLQIVCYKKKRKYDRRADLYAM